MSDSVDDGGPAFPTTCDNASERLSGMQMGIVSDGMTLRDYFAAKAMHAFLVTRRQEETCSSMASYAYDMADSMLEARDGQ